MVDMWSVLTGCLGTSEYNVLAILQRHHMTHCLSWASALVSADSPRFFAWAYTNHLGITAAPGAKQIFSLVFLSLNCYPSAFPCPPQKKEQPDETSWCTAFDNISGTKESMERSPLEILISRKFPLASLGSGRQWPWHLAQTPFQMTCHKSLDKHSSSTHLLAMTECNLNNGLRSRFPSRHITELKITEQAGHRASFTVGNARVWILLTCVMQHPYT